MFESFYFGKRFFSPKRCDAVNLIKNSGNWNCDKLEAFSKALISIKPTGPTLPILHIVFAAYQPVGIS